jgi:hypothetical protein
MARRSESSGSPSPPAEPLPLTMPQAAQATSLQLRRRFVFRGNAAAFGGRFVRPDDVFLEMPGASSLSVVGGRSVAAFRGPAENFKGYLSFDSATTFAEGKFDDREKAIALTHGKVKEETLVTSTRVRAEIKGLTVGTEKRLTVGRMVAELRSTSPRRGASEPPIPVGEVAIDDLAIDGYKLRVIFDAKVFVEHDTHAKLLRMVTKASFAKKYGPQFFANRAGSIKKRKQIHATLAARIEWEGEKNPRAEIVANNLVVVKDFGKIFLGEILINAGSRRLTLMRLELGSDGGGMAGGPDVDINGGYSP